MPTMIYKHSDATEKKMNIIKKHGYMNDVDVSNKSKIIDYAISLLSESLSIKNESVIKNKK